MKINELSFKNNVTGWELEKTKFGDLTLLVGASGVGKTQILKAIQIIVKISEGESFPGIQWDISMTASNGSHYRWTGEFDTIKDELQRDQTKPSIKNETLYLETRLVFERNLFEVLFYGKAVPKISRHSSVLDIFSEEEIIKPIISDFKRVILFNDTEEIRKVEALSPGASKEELYELIVRLEKVKQEKTEKKFSDFIGWLKTSRFPLLYKLFVIKAGEKELISEIVQDFQEVFPQVEEIDVVLIQAEKKIELQIKEKGTGWIPMDEISSGMFKTLMHIAELKLSEDDQVILIDEFENSLGANCIDTVADILLTPGRDVQYIITSHHPYIINNIDMKYWKVVTRKGSKVSTLNAEQLKLGKSKHEAFKQLLNLDEFMEGIS